MYITEGSPWLSLVFDALFWGENAVFNFFLLQMGPKPLSDGKEIHTSDTLGIRVSSAKILSLTASSLTLGNTCFMSDASSLGLV